MLPICAYRDKSISARPDKKRTARTAPPTGGGVSVSDAPPSLPRPRHQDDRHERQKRHEHERRDRNAQRPFHVFAHHFTSFRSNLQKRPHAAKVATAYLAVAAPPPADGAGALPVHAVHACRCGEPGSAVGEPGLELPARHRSDRGGVCPKAAEVLEKAEADALGYLDFPCEHHVSLRTKNVQERTDRELKRRSRVIQVFPSRK